MIGDRTVDIAESAVAVPVVDARVVVIPVEGVPAAGVPAADVIATTVPGSHGIDVPGVMMVAHAAIALVARPAPPMNRRKTGHRPIREHPVDLVVPITTTPVPLRFRSMCASFLNSKRWQAWCGRSRERSEPIRYWIWRRC